MLQGRPHFVFLEALTVLGLDVTMKESRAVASGSVIVVQG